MILRQGLGHHSGSNYIILKLCEFGLYYYLDLANYPKFSVLLDKHLLLDKNENLNLTFKSNKKLDV